MIYKVLGFVFLLVGAIIAFSAKAIVEKYQLDQKSTCSFEDELTEEELKKYKMTQAIVKIKIIGFAITLPGVIMILVMFR